MYNIIHVFGWYIKNPLYMVLDSIDIRLTQNICFNRFQLFLSSWFAHCIFGQTLKSCPAWTSDCLILCEVDFNKSVCEHLIQEEYDTKPVWIVFEVNDACRAVQLPIVYLISFSGRTNDIVFSLFQVYIGLQILAFWWYNLHYDKTHVILYKRVCHLWPHTLCNCWQLLFLCNKMLEQLNFVETCS